MRAPVLPEAVPTPAAAVLVDRLDRNLAAMAERAGALGVALSPHAKTHKTREITARQLALGAAGITVATVAEAEILTGPGTGTGVPGDVFIACPVWPADDLVARLLTLTDRVRVRVAVDSVAAAARLAPLAGRAQVMVELDCGLRRTGVAPGEVAGIARAASRAGLAVAGVFTFPGHSYAPGAGAAAAAAERSALDRAVSELAGAGFTGLVASGGSTPSLPHVQPGVLTEVRPGVYPLNDAQQVELGVVTEEQVAFLVLATVISRPAPGRVVLDSGSKALGADRAPWAGGYGLLAGWPGARITGLWEHHAVVDPGDGPAPELGSLVGVIPNHVCTAVNLHPELLAISGGEITSRWRVAARGANR